MWLAILSQHFVHMSSVSWHSLQVSAVISPVPLNSISLFFLTLIVCRKYCQTQTTVDFKIYVGTEKKSHIIFCLSTQIQLNISKVDWGLQKWLSISLHMKSKAYIICTFWSVNTNTSPSTTCYYVLLIEGTF